MSQRPGATGGAVDPENDAWPLACPVCDAALRAMPGTFVCPAGHSFDVAREGYINLLPPQHRARGIDGDSLGMLQARRRFLESGHFRPLVEKLGADVERLLQSRDAVGADSAPRACVLEVGCGEGYYVGNLAGSLRGVAGASATYVGADLSKSATRLAAKHYRDVRFVVADVNRRIYLQDETVSVLLDVFAPRNPSEFARVLEPSGFALVVIPTALHLGSLRTTLGLLDIQDAKETRVCERFEEEFLLVDRSELDYPIELRADEVGDLVHMGPNHWHRPDDEAPADGGSVRTAASFVILCFQRRGVAV